LVLEVVGYRDRSEAHGEAGAIDRLPFRERERLEEKVFGPVGLRAQGGTAGREVRERQTGGVD
jgi:hypothetical protein